MPKQKVGRQRSNLLELEKKVVAKIETALSLRRRQDNPKKLTRVYIGYSLRPFADLFTPEGKGKLFSKLQGLLERKYGKDKISFGVDGVENNFRAWVELN